MRAQSQHSLHVGGGSRSQTVHDFERILFLYKTKYLGGAHAGHQYARAGAGGVHHALHVEDLLDALCMCGRLGVRVWVCTCSMHASSCVLCAPTILSTQHGQRDATSCQDANNTRCATCMRYRSIHALRMLRPPPPQSPLPPSSSQNARLAPRRSCVPGRALRSRRRTILPPAPAGRRTSLLYLL